jgi:hypothetical protein
MKTFKQLLSDNLREDDTEPIDELSDTLLDRAAQAAEKKQKKAKKSGKVFDIAKRTVQKAKFQQKTTRPDMSYVA